MTLKIPEVKFRNEIIKFLQLIETFYSDKIYNLIDKNKVFIEKEKKEKRKNALAIDKKRELEQIF